MIPRNPNLPNLKRSKESDKLLSKTAREEIDSLFNISFRLTGSLGLAKKLLKRSYFSAAEFYEQTYITTDYKDWLYRIVLKRYNDDFNKNDKPNNQGINLKKNVDEETVIRILNQNKSEESLQEMISVMPSLLKNVLVLHDIHGFDYSMTGEYVDVPDGVVCMRIYRARNLLFYKLFNVVENTTDIFEITNEVEPDYPVAAIADNELEGEERRIKTEAVVRKESLLSTRLFIQQQIKKILKDYLPKISTPGTLKKRLTRRIDKATLLI